MADFFQSAVPILIALLVFGVLVVSHEWGHYIMARRQGIFVEEFAVGMGPVVWKKKKGDTLYSVRAFPVGGFCKLMGEAEETGDPRDFNNKTVMQRLSVMAAGPVMNFVVSFALIFILVAAEGFVATTIANVKEGFPAAEAGMLPGDRIVSLNGKRISIYEDVSSALYGNGDIPVEVTLKRDGKLMSYGVTPKYSEDDGTFLLGFTADYKTGIFGEGLEGFERAGLGESLGVSFHTMVFYIKSAAQGFVGLFTRKVSPSDMTGAIGIVRVIGESYESGLKHSVIAAVENICYIAALLSANLGAINLFPLPALDGGRLLLLIIEGIRGKALNREKEGLIHFAGFVLLFCLMIYLAYNDISKMI